MYVHYFSEMISIEEAIKTKKFSSEYHKLMVNMIYTSNRIAHAQHSFFKPYGLTTAQYNVLRILRGNYPTPYSINDIIDRMLDPMSNASRIVDKLETKALVQRKQNSTDRRAVDVLITEKGLDLLEKIDAALDWIEQSTNGQFSEEELCEANRLLDRLRAQL